jgi:hypothetical protein
MPTFIVPRYDGPVVKKGDAFRRVWALYLTKNVCIGLNRRNRDNAPAFFVSLWWAWLAKMMGRAA